MFLNYLETSEKALYSGAIKTQSLWIESYFLAIAKPWLLLDLTFPTCSLTRQLACCFSVYFIECCASQLIILENVALPTHPARPASLSSPRQYPILIYQGQQTPAQGHPSVGLFLTPILCLLILRLTSPFTLYGLILAYYYPSTRPWTWFMGSVSLPAYNILKTSEHSSFPSIPSTILDP